MLSIAHTFFVSTRRKSCIFPAEYAENNKHIIRTITERFLLQIE